MCDSPGDARGVLSRPVGRRAVFISGLVAPFAYRLIASDMATAAMAIAEPTINPRETWGADLPATGPLPAEDVRFLLVHHTQDPNSDYEQGAVRDVIRQIFQFHTGSEKGWHDIAYNFFVDKFGAIWEARSGSLAAARAGAAGVRGDATGGNQGYSQLCCFIGDFTAEAPPQVALDSMTSLLAWLANQYRVAVTPGSTVTFESLGSNLHAAGAQVTTPTITGHRFMSETDCPGDGCMPFVTSALTTVTKFMTAAGGAAPPSTSVPVSAGTPTFPSGPTPSGVSGVSGVSGSSGASGVSGSSGASDVSGVSGASGDPSGSSGAASPSGTSGVSAASGDSGAAGDSTSTTTAGVWSGGTATSSDTGFPLLPVGLGVGAAALLGAGAFLLRRKGVFGGRDSQQPIVPGGLALLPADDAQAERFLQYGPISLRVGSPNPEWTSGGIGAAGGLETAAVMCAGSRGEATAFVAAKIDALLDANSEDQEFALASALDRAIAEADAAGTLGPRAALMVTTPRWVYAAVCGESLGAAVRVDSTITKLTSGRLRRIDRSAGAAVLVSVYPIPNTQNLRNQLVELANVQTPSESEGWWPGATIAVSTFDVAGATPPVDSGADEADRAQGSADDLESNPLEHDEEEPR